MANRYAYKTDEERFWAKVAKDPGDGCWTWQGTLDRGGYAKFSIGAKSILGHRYAAEISGVVLDPALTLDHLCRNRACVRPSHTEEVTHSENSHRNSGRERPSAQRTHCPSGHPYEGDNVYTAKGYVWQRCRECNRAQAKRYKEAKKAASSPLAVKV